jgi:protein-S-isoprenylcysteine O-methyltransferase
LVDKRLKRNPKSTMIQFVGAFIFYFIWSLDSFIFRFSTFLSIYIPLLVRIIIFLGFFIIGCFLILRAGHIIYHEKENSIKLKKTGIFSYLRHPLYFGILMIYIGFIILTISLISIVLFVVIFFLYNYIANLEEKELEDFFGEEYLEYKKTVSKWFPRL